MGSSVFRRVTYRLYRHVLTLSITIIDALTWFRVHTGLIFRYLHNIIPYPYLLSFVPPVSNLGCIRATAVTHPTTKLRKMHRYLLFDLVRKHVPFAQRQISLIIWPKIPKDIDLYRSTIDVHPRYCRNYHE